MNHRSWSESSINTVRIVGIIEIEGKRQDSTYFDNGEDLLVNDKIANSHLPFIVNFQNTTKMIKIDDRTHLGVEIPVYGSL